ncbi:MAG: heme-binding protein [Bacteroidota bacterium]
MKTLFYGLVVLIPLCFGFQLYTNVAVSDSEKRPYDVLMQDGEVELRYYPSVNMATFEQAGDMENRNGNFRVLAGYIFGGNEEERSIAMTSPVEMESKDDGNVRMSFMMPTDIDMDSLPTPNDERIQLHTTEAFYAATIRFDGFADSEKIDTHAAELRDWLKNEKLKPQGNMIFLGYDPPYKMTDRRNEVMFVLKEKEVRKHPKVEI